MKCSNRKLPAAIVLMTATLFVSFIVGHRLGAQTTLEWITLGLNEKAKAESFAAQVRGGKVVGMTAVKKDGSRLTLKQQSKPTCATSCPSGQTLTCWEDYEQMMSICVCGTGGGGGMATGKVAMQDMH
jgi:hypothetical protein